jgi:transcription elongation factor Elf1
MHSTHLKKAATCPSCGRADLDGAMHVHAGPEIVEPEPGDVSVCGYCGAVNQFTEDMDFKSFDIYAPGVDPMDRARLRKLSEWVKSRRKS